MRNYIKFGTPKFWCHDLDNALQFKGPLERINRDTLCLCIFQEGEHAMLISGPSAGIFIYIYCSRSTVVVECQGGGSLIFLIFFLAQGWLPHAETTYPNSAQPRVPDQTAQK